MDRFGIVPIKLDGNQNVCHIQCPGYGGLRLECKGPWCARHNQPIPDRIRCLQCHDTEFALHSLLSGQEVKR